MKYKLVGKCGDKEVEFDSIKNAILKDYELFRETGNSYNLFYKNKRIERLKDVNTSFQDEIDYLKAEIGFIDDFSNCIYTGADTKDSDCRLSTSGCLDCGEHETEIYYIYDIFEETRERKALCKDCANDYRSLGYKVTKSLNNKKGKKFN